MYRQSDIPNKSDQPCNEHKLAFGGMCPELVAMVGYGYTPKSCKVCGWLTAAIKGKNKAL
jgi:hypothetical protein